MYIKNKKRNEMKNLLLNMDDKVRRSAPLLTRKKWGRVELDNLEQLQ